MVALNEIVNAYRTAANADHARPMAEYMRNRFVFLGLKQPVRKRINPPFFAYARKLNGTALIEVVRAIWRLTEREFQYLALETLEKTAKQWDENCIVVLEQFIIEKSWWDTVDTVAGRLLPKYFNRFPQHMHRHALRWSQSENIWLNRSAIIFQMKFKHHTDAELLRDCIVPHLASDEFFIQKGIGWALREYAYCNEKWVRQFVATHPLKPLSKREAMKHLS